MNYARNPKIKLPKLTKICRVCSMDFRPHVHTQLCCCHTCSEIYRKLYEEDRQRKQRKVKQWEIFNRDNFQCQYCGRNPREDKVKLHLDHIKSKFDGGTDDPDNLVTACDRCNIEKGTISIFNEALFKKQLKRNNYA